MNSCIHCSHWFGEPATDFHLAWHTSCYIIYIAGTVNSLQTYHVFQRKSDPVQTEERSHRHVTFFRSVIPVVNSNHGITDAAAMSSVGGSHTSCSSCGSGCSASCLSTAMEGVRSGYISSQFWTIGEGFGRSLAVFVGCSADSRNSVCQRSDPDCMHILVQKLMESSGYFSGQPQWKGLHYISLPHNIESRLFVWLPKPILGAKVSTPALQPQQAVPAPAPVPAVPAQAAVTPVTPVPAVPAMAVAAPAAPALEAKFLKALGDCW